MPQIENVQFIRLKTGSCSCSPDFAKKLKAVGMFTYLLIYVYTFIYITPLFTYIYKFGFHVNSMAIACDYEIRQCIILMALNSSYTLGVVDHTIYLKMICFCFGWSSAEKLSTLLRLKSVSGVT